MHKTLRKWLSYATGVMVLLGITLSFAQIVRMDFEQPTTTRWRGPMGGGANGGAGGGRVVSCTPGEYVYGGRNALRLEVWDDGSSEHAIAWAGVMHHMPCAPGARVEAEGWVYFSSTNAPLHENGAVHLQVEFFHDSEAEELMPEYVCVSAPVNPATHESDRWHRMSLMGRVPGGARSLRAGLIVTAQSLKGRKHAVWVDDLYVELKPRGHRVLDPTASRTSGPRIVTPSAAKCKSVALCTSTRYE